MTRTPVLSPGASRTPARVRENNFVSNASGGRAWARVVSTESPAVTVTSKSSYG